MSVTTSKFAGRTHAVRFGLTLTLAVLAGCGDSNDSDVDADAQEVAFRMQVLHLSDMDGSDAEALRSVAGMATLIERFKAEPLPALVLSSGDNYIPGPRFNASSEASLGTPELLGRAGIGRADIAMVNALGVQAAALGNHELDLGTGTFAELIATDEAWSGASFPYLAYNVNFAADSNTGPLVAANGLAANTLANKVSGWATMDVDGQTIGVIGASSPIFTTITSTGDLAFEPAETGGGNFDLNALAASIQRGVDEIKAAGINKIILISHMQKLSVERSLAPLLDGVDIIVGGGSNTVLADSNDVLRADDAAADTYPVRLRSASGEPVALVNTDADYKYLGRFIAPFTAEGVLIESAYDEQASGAWATPIDNAQTTNTALLAVRDALNEVLLAKDGTSFGVTNVFLEGRRAAVRNEETNLGNLTADANLFYANQAGQQAVISLKNGGGIRAEIGQVLAPPGSSSADELQLLPPAGNSEVNRATGAISQLAIETALKFNNTLTVLDLTAQQIRQLLEHSVAALGSQGRFPQVAGMSFAYDPQAQAQITDTDGAVTTAGERIRTLTIGSEAIVADGVIVGDANRLFRMVTLGFLAEGGDGYPFPAIPGYLVKLDEAGLAAGTASFAAPGTEQDALAEYLLARHADQANAFSDAETPPAQDTRIIRLAQ